MGRTLIRTDQLSNTLRQTFSNLSGIQPIFDFDVNGTSFIGYRTKLSSNLVNISDIAGFSFNDNGFSQSGSGSISGFKVVTSGESNITSKLFSAESSSSLTGSTQSLYSAKYSGILDASSQLNGLFFDFSGATFNNGVFGGLINLNPSIVSATTQYMAGLDVDIYSSVVNSGKSYDGLVVFFAENTTGGRIRGIGCSDSGLAHSPSLFSQFYRASFTGTLNNTNVMIGYYSSSGSTHTHSGSGAFNLFRGDLLGTYTGTGNVFGLQINLQPANTLASSKTTYGVQVVINNNVSAANYAGVRVQYVNGFTSGRIRGFSCVDAGLSYSPSLFSHFYESSFSGTWSNSVGTVGYFNGFSGTFNGPGLISGFFSSLQGILNGQMNGVRLDAVGTINGTYTGIEQPIIPGSVGAGATIIGHKIQMSNLDGAFRTGCEISESGTVSSGNSTLLAIRSSCNVSALQNLHSISYDGTVTGTVYGSYINYGLANINGGFVFGQYINLIPLSVSSAIITGISISIGQNVIENSIYNGVDIQFSSSLSGSLHGIRCFAPSSNTFTDISSLYKVELSGTISSSSKVVGFHNVFSGSFSGVDSIIGLYNEFSGSFSKPIQGILLQISSVTGNINNDYTGIEQFIEPNSIDTGIHIVGYSVKFSNLATTATECIGYRVLVSGLNITSNFGLGMLFGKLGTATDINQYNSFTTRWTSSNWNTGTSAVENIDWDVRAIGVSGNPPNSRFGVFGEGTELFNVQREGDIEVTTADKGIILKSPNGTRYRVKVTDAGGLVTEAA